MNFDQPFIPRTRSQRGLQPFDPSREDEPGENVSEAVKKEIWEAIGESPLSVGLRSMQFVRSQVFCQICSNPVAKDSCLGGPHISSSMLLDRQAIQKILITSTHGPYYLLLISVPKSLSATLGFFSGSASSPTGLTLAASGKWPVSTSSLIFGSTTGSF